jgi:cytochrome c556
VAAQPAAAVTVAQAPAVQAAAAPAAVPTKQSTPTTRSYMRGHFLDTARMREAIVMGKLAELQAAAAAVASDPWTPKLREDYRPYVNTMRAAARSAQTAESVVSGATALGKLGDACASCHLKFGGPGSPIAPLPMAEDADPGMVAHALATERLWEGLILPSDTSWLGGARVLREAPKLDSDVSEVAAAARHLSDLAQTATSATAAERSKVFGNILLTCNACHERLGIRVATPQPH